jgi:hypothetical protein
MKSKPKPKSAQRRQAAARARDWRKVASLAQCDDPDAPRPEYVLVALKRLGVTEEQLNTAPPLTPLLKLAHGGIAQVLDAMRLSEDADLARFLAKYDSLSPTDRKIVPFEAVALAANLNTRALLGPIMYALQAQSVSLVKLLTLSSHPEVVKARIKYARMPAGHADRHALDTALGLLPSPRGATIINKAIFGSGKAAMDAQKPQRLIGAGPEDDEESDEQIPLADDPSEYDLDKLFPPANRMQEKLVAIRQRTKPLPPSDKIQ